MWCYEVGKHVPRAYKTKRELSFKASGLPRDLLYDQTVFVYHAHSSASLSFIRRLKEL